MENLPEDLREFITKAKRLRQQQREASHKYYKNKYTITDTMTEEEKELIKENIARRKALYKAKYEANKELYKQRAKEYREIRKNINQAQQLE